MQYSNAMQPNLDAVGQIISNVKVQLSKAGTTRMYKKFAMY
jgi:hypothetical protein